MKRLMLLFAGIFEIIRAIAMKYSNGFTVLIPSIVTAITYYIHFKCRILGTGFKTFTPWNGLCNVGCFWDNRNNNSRSFVVQRKTNRFANNICYIDCYWRYRAETFCKAIAFSHTF